MTSWGQLSDRQLTGVRSLQFGRAFLPLHRSRRPKTSKWGRTLMNARSSTLRSLLVAGILGALLVAAPALAQQTPGQPSDQPAPPSATSQPPPTPRGETPAPSMQPQPTTVPGRPD